MPYSIFTDYNDLDDEEEKKKPSQVAATTQKDTKKETYTIFSEFNNIEAQPEPQKIEAPKETPKPKSLVQKATDFVSDLFGVKKKESQASIDAAKYDYDPGGYSTKLDNYLKFPSLFPNPDLTGPGTPSSATPTVQGKKVLDDFFKNPVDTAINAARDVLSYHPQGVDLLAGAQQSIEELLNKNAFLKGTVKGVGLTFFGSSHQVQDLFESRLTQSVTWQDKSMETVGEAVGGIVSFIAGGSALKAAGFAKAAMPVLFATMGQLAAAPDVTGLQRLEKIPVDLFSGYLFDRIPGFKGKGSEIFKNAVKGTAKATGIGSLQGYVNAKIEGKSDKEAAQIATQIGLTTGALYFGMGSLGLLAEQIGKTSKNIDYLPEEVSPSASKMAVNVNGKRISTDLSPEELAFFNKETENVLQTKGKEVLHLDSGKALRDSTTVSREEFLKAYPEAQKSFDKFNKPQAAVSEIKPETIPESTPKSAPVVKPVEKTVDVPRSQLPVGEGKLKASKLESRVNKVLDKTPEEIQEKLGLATYKEMSKKENIAAATKFVTDNPDDALKVLSGDMDAPKGVLRNSIYIAMENASVGDAAMARRLASLGSTRMGQEISILSEINPDSPVRKMTEVINVREQAFKDRTGKTPEKAIREATKAIKSKIKTPDKHDWATFVNSIQC